MRVVVNGFEAGLVHVLMSVLGSVFVAVGVLMRNMVVLMRGVRMCVNHIAMTVFMRMRRLMGVLLSHGCLLLMRNMLCLLIVHPVPGPVRAIGGDDDSVTAFSPLSPR